MTKSVHECIAAAEEWLTGASDDLRRYSGVHRAEISAQVGAGWAQLAQAKLAAEAMTEIKVTQTGWVAEAVRSHATDRCGHKVLVMLVGDHWVHVANMVRCDDPPVMDGPIPPVAEAP